MDDNKIFQITAHCVKIATAGASLRIIFDTQENLSPDAKGVLFSYYDKLGWLCFAVRQIENDDLLQLPVLKIEEKYTPAQRMRNVMYRIWEQDDHGKNTFDEFYLWYMEKMIEKLKEKLL